MQAVNVIEDDEILGLCDYIEQAFYAAGAMSLTPDGNGYTFDRYEANLLLDAVNRAKTTFFTDRYHWDEMVRRDMQKDVSWENSARQYKDLYLALTADRP